MTNFIFKSQGTYKKLVQQLEIIQSELRHQRIDMVQLLFLVKKWSVDKNLQKQVDEYFEEDMHTDIPDTEAAARDLD